MVSRSVGGSAPHARGGWVNVVQHWWRVLFLYIVMSHNWLRTWDSIHVKQPSQVSYSIDTGPSCGFSIHQKGNISQTPSGALSVVCRGGDPFTIEYQKAVPFIHMEIHWVWIRLPQGNTRVCACVFLCFRSSFSAWLKGNFVGCCAWFSHGQVFSIPEVRFGCDFSCKCSFGFVANPLDGK